MTTEVVYAPKPATPVLRLPAPPPKQKAPLNVRCVRLFEPLVVETKVHKIKNNTGRICKTDSDSPIKSMELMNVINSDLNIAFYEREWETFHKTFDPNFAGWEVKKIEIPSHFSDDQCEELLSAFTKYKDNMHSQQHGYGFSINRDFIEGAKFLVFTRVAL